MHIDTCGKIKFDPQDLHDFTNTDSGFTNDCEYNDWDTIDYIDSLDLKEVLKDENYE